MVNAIAPDDPEAAKDILSQSPITELRELKVSEDRERVFISGRVSSFYHKQLAQETVRQAAHGRSVVNDVAVDR